MLDDALYDPVREILAASSEGKLLEYEILLVERLATQKAAENGDSL